MKNKHQALAALILMGLIWIFGICIILVECDVVNIHLAEKIAVPALVLGVASILTLAMKDLFFNQ